MAEHNKLDANTERILESMENVRIRSEAQFKEINILLEALLQQYNLSLDSLHGAANSSKETVRQPCQLQEENTTPDSLNIALLASDEIIPSTEPIEEQSVTDEDSVGQLVVTESVKEIRVAVDQGEIFPSIEPNEAHSVTDEASVGRLSRSWGSVKHHQREVQLARIDSESPTEKTPSLYSTIATIPLLEPEDAALFSEWRCTTDPPRPEKRCAGSRSKCRYHTRRNNPTPSPPPKPPDWTHDAVANPLLPPEPPDLRCCRVAGRRFYLTPPYRACHIHSCLGILEQFHAYYYKNSVLRLNSDLEASLAQSCVESYQTLLAYCIVKDKIFRTAVGLLVDDQNYYLSHGGVTTLLKYFEHSDCKGNLVGPACGVLRNTVGVEEIQRQMVIREGGICTLLRVLNPKGPYASKRSLHDGNLTIDNEPCSSDGVTEVELFMPFLNVSFVQACSQIDVCGILSFRGLICSVAYLNAKEPISQTIIDIKGDIITSLQGIMNIICDEAEGNSGSNHDVQKEGSEDMLVAKTVLQVVLQLLRKDCSFLFPRRVFAPCLVGTHVCDFLQPSETVESLKDHYMELLSMKVQSDVSRILKLEKEVISYSETHLRKWTASAIRVSHWKGLSGLWQLLILLSTLGTRLIFMGERISLKELHRSINFSTMCMSSSNHQADLAARMAKACVSYGMLGCNLSQLCEEIFKKKKTGSVVEICASFDGDDIFQLVKCALLVTYISQDNILVDMGIHIKTWANVPRDSGVAASSILTATVVKGLLQIIDGDDCFLHTKGVSQFKQWDPGGCSLVHWEGPLDLEVT